MDWILVIAGLAGLFLGGDALVRGAVGLARRFAMPPLLVGLTVVGFGTSMPELLVSLGAALRGAPDIAIGNVVGSNIGNIMLIAALAALVWPIRLAGPELRRDLVVMLGASAALVLPFGMGQLERAGGAMLLAALLAYLLWSYLRPQGAVDTDTGPVRPPWASLLWAVGGLAALMLGAQALVTGSVNIARGQGISEAFIAVSIVAVGTSLPELATSVIAALRRQSAIAIGNIVGSNIFNVLGILGATALVTPIPVAARFVTFDLPVMLGASLVLALLLWWRGGMGRVAAAALLAGYAGYLWAGFA